jgi:hypothetical protein
MPASRPELSMRLMGHEATSRAGQQRGSAMGAHYRHTTPEMAARVVAAVPERLVVVLATAEVASSPANPGDVERCSEHAASIAGRVLAKTLRADCADPVDA